LPLLIGAGSATLVIAIATSAIHQPRPSLTTNPNKPDTTPIKPETTPIKPDTTSIKPKKTSNQKPEAEPKKNCVVVVSSTNLRSLSGRQRTGKVVEAGTKVTVTGKEAEGWIEISSPVSGWL